MITTSFNSGPGQIELNILSIHTSTATVSQIGQLRYSFDQTPDTLSIDKVQALYTYMNITLLQHDDGGYDLWEVLINETDRATLQATFDVVLQDGAFQFLFKVRKSDISLDEKSGTITIRLTPYIDESAVAQDVFDAIETKKQFRTVRGGGEGDDVISADTLQKVYPAVGVKEFIEEGLNLFFGNAYTNVIRSSKTELGDDYTESIFDDLTEGKKAFTMVEATVANGLERGQFNDDEALQGSGSITITDVTDYNTQSSRDYRYAIDAVGAGLSAVQPGDRLFYTGGSSIGLSVAFVDTVGGVPRAGIVASEETMTLPREGAGVVANWSYATGTDPANIKAIDLLKDLAGIEGSIFGSGFSTNFFIHRLSTDEAGEITKTINYNEAIDFKPFNFDLSLGKSFVGQIANYRSFGAELFGQWPYAGKNSGVPNLSAGKTYANGNFGASKGIEIELAPAYPLLNKGLVSGTFVEGIDIRGVDTNLESALTRNGLKSYFQSLNASKGSIAVEFSVIGSQRVLPYELFQFDSRAPEKYRDKQFRITEVSYDFVRDTCKIKGYQISSITTPVVDDPPPRIPPPRIVPPFTADPIGVLLRGVDDADVDTLRINFYTSINTGSSIMVLNDLEREEGYFGSEGIDAGQYEVNTDKGDVADPEQGDFIGALRDTILGKGSTFLAIRIVAQEVITLTAGDSLVLHNLAGQTETVVVRTTTVTTVGGTTVVPINSVVINNLYQAELGFVATPSYTPNIEVTTFPSGDSEIPLDGTSRINAPEGSFVYLTDTYEGTGERITKAFTQEINLRLIDTDSNLVATQESLLNLVSTVSNVNGVVTAQGSFIVSLNSTVTNIETDVSGQATAIFNLNTRVTSGEGYLISNASAITAIGSRIDDPVTGLNASATAITLLETNVSNIEGNIVSTASAITAIQSNITGIEGDIDAQASAISILETNVSVIEGNIVSTASAITAIESNITGIEGEIDGIDFTIDAQATAISSLETNVSSIDGTLTATAEKVDVIEANVTTLDEQFTAVSSDVSDVSIEVDEVTGKVTNISAKRAIVVGAGGKLANIDLSVEGDGSTATSFIEISADQVKIQDIIFDDEGAVYSSSFLNTGTITAGKVEVEGDDGWAFDRTGNVYVEQLFFRKEALTLEKILNPPTLTSAFGVIDMSGSGQDYAIDWTINSAVLGTDQVEIRHFRNGTELGKATTTATALTLTTNYAGGTTSDDCYVTVTLIRGGNARNSITTKDLPFVS